MSIPSPRPLQPRGLRRRLFSTDPKRLASEVAESLRHLQTLIDALTQLRVKTVEFTAGGTSPVPLGGRNRDAPPAGVIAIRAFETKAPDTSPTLTTPLLSTVWEGATRTLSFDEPGGLTADTSYTLTVLIIG